MGRPVNKRNFGNAADKIQVSRYRRVGGSSTNGNDNTHIVKQTSTREFIVSNGTWTDTMQLVSNKSMSDTLDEGTFIIIADNADGNDRRLDKLFNNVAILTDGTDVEKEGWGIADDPSTARPTPDPHAGRARIDGQAS